MNKVRCLYIICLFLFFVSNRALGQNTKTLIEEDFTIRDFIVSEDSIFYIKKRDAYLYDRRSQTSNSFFVGGYGLKIINARDKNKIISISNELVDTISSVRFYNKTKKRFDFEFYYKEGKILDFVDIPEASLFAFSSTNNKIIFFDYKAPPEFVKTIEINLKSLSRKIIHYNKFLYFVTDKGKIYQYNFYNYKKKLLYQAGKAITEFIIDGQVIYYTTIDGGIYRVNIKSKSTSEIHLDKNLVSALAINENYLVCGSWSGMVYLVDLSSFSIQKSWPIHKRAILKIKKGKNNIMYSSGLDKTIKSWKIH